MEAEKEGVRKTPWPILLHFIKPRCCDRDAKITAWETLGTPLTKSGTFPQQLTFPDRLVLEPASCK